MWWTRLKESLLSSLEALPFYSQTSVMNTWILFVVLVILSLLAPTASTGSMPAWTTSQTSSQGGALPFKSNVPQPRRLSNDVEMTERSSPDDDVDMAEACVPHSCDEGAHPSQLQTALQNMPGVQGLVDDFIPDHAAVYRVSFGLSSISSIHGSGEDRVFNPFRSASLDGEPF